MLKTKRNMQDKKFQYRGYLIVVLVITFLLAGNITYTNAREEPPATISSRQHELKGDEALHSIQLDFRLVGTVIAGEDYSYAIIMDETTGKQSMYKLGESINEATVLKIDKESIVVKEDGRSHVLKIMGGNSSEIPGGDVLPSTTVSGKLPHFEPVLSETGPPVNESVPFEGLPNFEPVYSETGPPVDKNVSVGELPRFEPITNSVGLQIDDEGSREKLPEFNPSTSYTRPPE